MREILFKAKRIDNGEWVEGDLSQHKTGKKFIKAGSATHSFEVDADTICQYTGLTDKNGNKIWENDVVEIYDKYFHLHWEEDVARFIMENYDERFSVDFDNYWDYEVEVMGNIFDNPELVKEGTE